MKLSKIDFKTLVNIVYTLVAMFIMYFFGSFISQLLSTFIIIPGNIIGMGLLYLSLELKLVQFHRIKATGDFLLKHLSLFFIPFGVSIMKYYHLLKGNTIYFIIILLVSTVAALTLSALVVEKVTGGKTVE